MVDVKTRVRSAIVGFLLLTAVMSSATSSAAAASSSSTLRVASYNVLFANSDNPFIGTDPSPEQEMKDLARYIVAQDLDVIGLQELVEIRNLSSSGRCSGTKHVDDDQVLRDELARLGWASTVYAFDIKDGRELRLSGGMEDVPEVNNDRYCRKVRNAIFSRLPITKEEVRQAEGEEGNVQVVQIEHPQIGTFTVSNHHPPPHLGCEAAARVADTLKRYKNESRRVVLGDFNLNWDNAQQRGCLETSFLNDGFSHTCDPDARPMSECGDSVTGTTPQYSDRDYVIDYVLLSDTSGLYVTDSSADQSNQASDHLPVLAELSTAPPTSPPNPTTPPTPTPTPTPTPSVECGVLKAGEHLVLWERLTSCDGRVSLVLQSDGNLVLYYLPTSEVLWASDTVTSTSPRGLYMQDAGNLVVYEPDWHPTWWSGTESAENAGSRLVVQSDGNMVLYAPDGRYTWASHTHVATSGE